MTAQIAFLWPELPAYAARCIRAVVDRHQGLVHVIATKPRVPIEGMEDILGDSLTWVDGGASAVNWQSLGLDTPHLVFSGSYSTPAFQTLTAQAKRHGANVVMTADNNWTGSLRQKLVDPLRHRLIRRGNDAVFVPGASGETWAKAMGYPEDMVFRGLYGADPALFKNGPPLAGRPKTFLFVGQFIDRKNVMRLAQAFVRASKDLTDWNLRLCGSGPLRDALPKHPQIVVEDFVQPDRLSGLMQEARCLVLPSLEEHWGLVVHEATLSGCALALSHGIGAADDLARPDNAQMFAATDQIALETALRTIAGWEEARWQKAQETSLDLARAFGPKRFADSVAEISGALIGAQA